MKIWEGNWLPNKHGFRVWPPRLLKCEATYVYHLIDRETNAWNYDMVSRCFLSFELFHISLIPLGGISLEAP